jgi:hypothetical protein
MQGESSIVTWNDRVDTTALTLTATAPPEAEACVVALAPVRSAAIVTLPVLAVTWAPSETIARTVGAMVASDSE